MRGEIAGRQTVGQLAELSRVEQSHLPLSRRLCAAGG